jgi:Recombination directionality factor-like
MPILDIQKRLTQLGVIRLGRQVPTGKTNRRGEPTFRPEKLDRFRITSPDQAKIAEIAARYGGTPAQWRGPSGQEWEVITDAKSLPVLVPPQKIDPNYELWGNGFRARLCDGGTERQRNAGCLCIQGEEGHIHDFVFGGQCECGEKRECKPTTRLSLMLAAVPGLGVWKLESHGRNAAAELPMTSDALEAAPGPVPATLIVQFVEKKILANAGKNTEKIEPRSFFVPRLVFDFVTPEQAFSGQIGAAAKAALSGRPAQPAIASAPSGPTVDQLIALVKLAKNRQQLAELWEDAKKVAIDGDPDTERLKIAFADAGARLNPPAEKPAAPVEQPPVDVVVDAEVVDENGPDADTVWMLIVGEAGKRQWSTPDVEQRYRDWMKQDPREASAGQLQTFLTALKNDQVS